MRMRQTCNAFLRSKKKHFSIDSSVQKKTFSYRQQCELKKKLITVDVRDWFDDEKKIRLKYVGGVDISFMKNDKEHACAALVVLSLPKLEVSWYEILL